MVQLAHIVIQHSLFIQQFYNGFSIITGRIPLLIWIFSPFLVLMLQWMDTNPEKDLSRQQNRKLVAKVLKIACLNIFRNNIYTSRGSPTSSC